MNHFWIKLGNEYLITQTLSGKPGKILKGPGIKWLNPVSMRPVPKHHATGAELATILENRNKKKIVFYEKFAFRENKFLGDIKFRTLDGQTGICKAYAETNFLTVKDVYKYYWVQNNPYQILPQLLKSKLLRELNQSHSSQLHHGSFIPRIVAELQDLQSGLYGKYGLFVQDIMITHIEL